MAIAITSTVSAVIPDSVLTVVTNELMTKGYITFVDERTPTHTFLYGNEFGKEIDSFYNVKTTGIQKVFMIDKETGKSYQIEMNFKERKAFIRDGKNLFIVDDKILYKKGFKYVKVECE